MVAVLAGLVRAGTVAIMLSASAMFLGWVAYGINSKTTAEGYANLACYVFGVGFGLVTTIIINWLTPSIGLTATGLAIFAVVVLVMCLRAGTPFNNPLAYFLGITSFFYSGLAPSFGAFAIFDGGGRSRRDRRRGLELLPGRHFAPSLIDGGCHAAAQAVGGLMSTGEGSAVTDPSGPVTALRRGCDASHPPKIHAPSWRWNQRDHRHPC